MDKLTEEEWECVRVCVANAPIPYDITKKKIPAQILEKIGQPQPRKGEPLVQAKYDLSQYGIDNWTTSKNLQEGQSH